MSRSLRFLLPLKTRLARPPHLWIRARAHHKELANDGARHTQPASSTMGNQPRHIRPSSSWQGRRLGPFLNLCTLLFFMCSIQTHQTARGIPQHRVRASRRSVSYGTISHPTAKFWIPSRSHDELQHDAQIHSSSRDGAPFSSTRARERESSFSSHHYEPAQDDVEFTTRRVRQQKDEESSYWYIHGDASSLSSHHASLEDWYHHHRRRRRRQQQQRRRRLQSDTRALNQPDVVLVEESDSPNVQRLADATRPRRTAADAPLFAPNTALLPEDTPPDDGVLIDGTTNPGENETHKDSWNVSSQVEPSNETTTNETVVYTSATSNVDNTTNSSFFSFQPTRIRAILSEQQGGLLNEMQRTVLFQDIISPAILAWSAALRVHPVEGNLTVDADQLYDGATCGPGVDSGFPSVPVPLSHLTTGIADTDLIVYMSIGFASDNATAGYSRAGHEVILPACAGEYLAAASYCSTDQLDRPTAGMLHLCIDDEFFEASSVERNTLTIIHELGHVVGFNTQSFAHFRRPDGSPITPRINGDVVDTEVECTGLYPRRKQIIPLPSEDILQFRTVRGVRVAEIVTPSVRQVVRNHFDCQALNGAELESGLAPANVSNLTLPEGSCISDHLEKRLFRDDLMNPVLDEVPFSLRIPTVALALLADSGWYQVDLSRTSYPSAWGRGAGCSFVVDTCISDDGQVPLGNAPFFCNDALSSSQQGTTGEIHGCSADMSRKATCSMARYDSDLPTEYQYFGRSFGAFIGGDDPFLDFCPVFSGFSNGACRDRSAKTVMKVSDIETFGRRNARCVTGSLEGQPTAFCLSTACVVEDHTFHVRVGKDWKKCDYGGQALLSDEANDHSVVICPDPVRACPVFYCLRDCLGMGGICNFTSGECVCGSSTLSNTTSSTNSTNSTLVASTEDNSTVVSNSKMCDNLPPDGRGHFYSEVQDSRSPLVDPSASDYYYPTEEDLYEDQSGLASWIIVLAAVVATVSVLLVNGLLVWWYARRRRKSLVWFRTADPQAESPGELSPGVNKDKFVASMLLDMRVHGLEAVEDDQVVDRLSQTDESLTETDRSSENFTVSSSLHDSIDDVEDRSSTHSGQSKASSNRPTPQLPPHNPELTAKGFMRKRVVKDGP